MMIESMERRVLFAAGDLVGSFASDGVFSTEITGLSGGEFVSPLGAVVQTDGRLVTAVISTKLGLPGQYQLTLQRLNTDGTVDLSFAASVPYNASLATISYGGLVQTQDGGLIAAAGKRLYRFDSNGNVDANFASNGVYDFSTFSSQLVPTDPAMMFTDVAELADGRLIAVGGQHVVVLNANGSLDTQFGYNSGSVNLSYVVSGALWLSAVDVNASGVYISGSAGAFGSKGRLFVWKLNPTLTSVDVGFGQNSLVRQQVFGKDVVTYDAQWFDDGTGILLVGRDTYNASMIRLLADGSIDTSFGGWSTDTPGVVRILRDPDHQTVTDISLLADDSGRFYTAGMALNGATAWVSRFNPDGTPDFTFSGDGYVRLDSSSRISIVGAAALDESNGRLYLASRSDPTIGPDSAKLLAIDAGESAPLFTIDDTRARPLLVVDRLDDTAGISAGIGDVVVTGASVTLAALALPEGRLVFDRNQLDVQVRLGSGPDTITVQAPVKIDLDTGAGDDTVWVFYGSGTVTLGEGNDTADVHANSMRIDAGDGNDTVNLRADDSVGFGRGGDDQIISHGYRNRIYGHEGNDQLTLKHAGYALGGDGDDRILGSDEADTLYGESGNDRIDGLAADDLLVGGAGRDTILGGYGNDRIYGDADPDRLYGDDGNDTLDGAHGSDILNGGNGEDHLNGGTGNNRFYARDNRHDRIWGRGYFSGSCDPTDRLIGLIFAPASN
jgi:uncharacterized delta-60 repeat protein